MGRLEKAIERLKNQSGPAAAIRPPPGLRHGGAPAAFESIAARARPIPLEHDHLAANRILTDDADPTVRGAYKMLRTRILQRMRASSWQGLAITSASAGDGKSLTAVNLAISIAGDVNQNVVLVDLDLRHSTVSRYLGLPVDVGVSDCLRRGIPVEDVLVRPDIERLLVLPNVHVEQHSSELVASPEMEALARRLVRDDPGRIVIYDLPPILSADDMLAFAPFADCVLFVIGERMTDRTEVLRARELLEEINVVGTVLNRSDERTAAYY
jgi:Mrp family chromosome partitioning ATPase